MSTTTTICMVVAKVMTTTVMMTVMLMITTTMMIMVVVMIMVKRVANCQVPVPQSPNPGLVEFLVISNSDPATCTSLKEIELRPGSSCFQHYNAGILVENSTHVQKRSGQRFWT